MSQPIFYEGQQVGCLMFGEGVILEMDSNNVCVKFDGGTEEFYHNGTYMQHLRPTLYPIEQYREIIANLPAPQPEPWKPKPGEWCWFWDDNAEGCALIAKFVRMSNGKYTMIHLNTEWEYTYCAPFVGELPEHLKEVKS